VKASGTAEEWMRVSVKATECPRIPAKFLESERGAMTSDVFAQEYLCEFHGDGTEYFDAELIARAVDLSVPELRIDGQR
jgi:phage FluMu gp28-like protein